MPVRFALAPCAAAFITAVCLFAAGNGPAGAAGPDCGGAVPCLVDGGEYRIVLPAGGAPKGVVVFFHGYRGSAEAQMRARGLVEAAAADGYAFAAPDGADGSWSHDGSPPQDRDDTAFATALLDDLSDRFGFGPERVVVAGFSQGASMALHVVCHMGHRVAGAITIAGVFWEPLPTAKDCEDPPPLFHVHGRADTVFPLEGRPIGGRWRQADTRQSLAVLAERSGCAAASPLSVETPGLTCETRPRCNRGTITLCLHDGGHDVHASHFALALSLLSVP